MTNDRGLVLPGSKKQGEVDDRPLITIGVTTYDRPQLLRQCVDSILSQSYSNIEVIIGNDFVPEPVTFNSLGIKEDLRVRIVNHPKNIGAYNNNYYLLRVASGELFTWLADDDLMHPDFLNIAHEILSKFNVNCVFTNYVAQPDPCGSFPKKIAPVAPKVLSGAEFMAEYTSRRIKVIGNYGVFRRELFEKLGSVRRFGAGLPVYGDTFMPIVAASLGNVAYVDLDLVFLRTHVGSRSASLDCIDDYSSAQKDFLSEFDRCCREYLGGSEYQRQLVGMLQWFAADGWHVIGRRHSSVYQRVIEFFRYVIDTLAPRLPSSSRGAFGLSLVVMVMVDSLKYSASRFLKVLKCRI